jgi:putative mRNA 3-end processing factor
MQVIGDSGAQRVLVTHGYNAVVARWLREQGVDAQPIDTRFEGEGFEGEDSELIEDAAPQAADQAQPVE